MQNKLFEVIVVATMSAGKTTVINSLIGMELLHSANEATTATITVIHNKDDLKDFKGNAYDYYDNIIETQESISSSTLRQWNADKNIKKIDLVGNIQTLHNDTLELVLYDTPGPNNSQDDNHEALTMEVINDGNYGLILYVINATQLGINDDKILLNKIRRTLDKDPHKEIIFLLNKADCLDHEKGESLDNLMNNAKTYISNNGFDDPVIIPICAKDALIASKYLNNQTLTRSQKHDLKAAFEHQHDDFIHYATIERALKKQCFGMMTNDTDSDQSNISPKTLQNIIIRSGVGILSQFLQLKINKISS